MHGGRTQHKSYLDVHVLRRVRSVISPVGEVELAVQLLVRRRLQQGQVVHRFLSVRELKRHLLHCGRLSCDTMRIPYAYLTRSQLQGTFTAESHQQPADIFVLIDVRLSVV